MISEIASAHLNYCHAFQVQGFLFFKVLKQFYLTSQGMDDAQVRSAATDIFSYLVEYNPSMVREFVMQEAQQNDDVSRRSSEAFLEGSYFCLYY